MELNINNWKIKLIRSTYAIKDPDKLPKSLCSFFWVFLSSIILFPLCIWGHLFNFQELFSKSREDSTGYDSYNNAFGVGIIMLFIAGAFGWSLTQHEFLSFLHLPTNQGFHNLYDLFIDFVSLYYYSLVFIILLIIVLLCVILPVAGVKMLIEKHKEKKKEEFKKQFLLENPEYKENGWNIPYYLMKEKKVKQKVKNPSIIWEYAKAVKGKFCPTINYKGYEK